MRWDIRINSHFFMAAGFLAVCVMAAPDYLHFTPTASALCFWSGLIGAVCFAIAGFRTGFLGEGFKPRVGHFRRMVGLYGMVVCAVGFVGFAATYLWTSHKEVKAGATSGTKAVTSKEPHQLLAQQPLVEETVGLKPAAPVERRPLTMRQLFDSDFNTYQAVGQQLEIENTTSRTVSHLSVRLLANFESRTKFLAVYLNNRVGAYTTATYVLYGLRDILKSLDDAEISTQRPGDTALMLSADLLFTDTVYFYMEQDLPLQEQASLEKLFIDHKIQAHFLGRAYYAIRMNELRSQR